MQKTNIFKRIAVLFLVLYTTMGLLPITTLAEGPTSVTTEAELISVFTDGGAAVMVSNITLTEPLVAVSGKTVTLDLNGKTIDRGLTGGTGAFYGNVITVNGSLTLNDSIGSGQITGGRKSAYTGGGGIYVAGTGALTMNGGSVSGNVAEGSSVNGSIAGGNGGGVYVAEGGTFAMSAGAVSNNRSAGSGGGIYVETNGSLSMSNGSISGNTAAQSGGGVYVVGSPFTMDNGTINGNTAAGSTLIAGYGGGVAVVTGGVFTMNGGNISGNTATGDGGGVYVFFGGKLAMNAGTVSSNSAVDGGGIYFDKTQNPAYGEGTLTISGGEVRGNTATSNGGGVYVASGAFSVNNCVISGNRAVWGGGIFMLNGTSTMENSEICENTTYEDSGCQGGGVWVGGGAFTMKSSKIDLNKAASGGGVYAFSGTFTMESGEINNNNTYALEGLCNGGGVYVSTGSTFSMKGGEICGNTTTPWYMYSHGGGVYVYGGAFKVSGGAKIVNNSRGGVPNNVYLKTNGDVIQIEGQLTCVDGSIGVSSGVTEAVPLTVAQGSGYTVSDDDKNKFVRDTGGILNLADNKITVPDPNTSYLIYLSYNANGGSGSQLSSAILEGMPNSITVASGENLTRVNCSFAGWNTKADGSGTPYQPGSTFTLTANTVLYAQWTIVKAELSVTAPNGGAAPSGTAACVPSGITASLTWKQGENTLAGSFDYNTVYSAEVTLTASPGCKWAGAPEATVNGQSGGSVQRNSDSELVVSYTFAKTGPHSAPTAAISPSGTINIVNTGGSQTLTLNVAGIAENYNAVTWTMSVTADSGNILTLPSTTAGTLLNGALSLGSIVVAPNAAGQPAKSASVTISFSGNENGEYAGLPAPITVSFQLAAGGAPAAVMDFINERINGVSSDMEYIISDSTSAPVDWSGAATVAGTEIAISGSIPSAGADSKYIYIRYKGISGSVPTRIEIPARYNIAEDLDWDSWVVHNIENDIESGYVPWDYSYRINNGPDTPGSSDEYLVIPLAPGDTLTFWLPASVTHFKSNEINVTAPARLPNTNVGIDFAAEKLNTTGAMQYRLNVGDDWDSCSANMAAAAFGWNGTAAVSIQLRYPWTADNYASQTQNLSIPARPAAPVVNYTATATKITVAAETGVRYRLNGGQWKTADENGTVTFTGLTANQSYTIDAERLATSTAFGNTATSSVSTGSTADGTGSVSMASWTYGGTALEPVPVSATNGTGSVSYAYSGTKADGTAYNSSVKPTDAGSYTVTATFAATSDYEQVISQAASFTIEKKEIDVQWKNLTAVYDGAPKSPVLTLIGVKSGDTADVSAELSESKTSAGSYSVTAALSGSRAFNYRLTNPSGTMIIQKAPVIFSITADSAQYDGSGHTAAVTAAASGSVFSAFSVIYKNSSGHTVASPSDEGSYGIYAQITDANYRHADAADGAVKKIGVLTIYAVSAPDTYTVSFSGGDGAVGSVATLTAAQEGTVRILPESEGMTNGTKLFAGWKYDGNVYQPGESLFQPGSNITLAAIWTENSYSISGVVYQGGTPLPDAVVTLMRGCVQTGQTVTGAGGEYSFTDTAPGLYNIVASKKGVTQTVLTEIIQSGFTNQNIILPSGKTCSVVEVAAGSPAIVVGNLEQTFSNADQQEAGNGSTVEMKLSARALESSGAEQSAIDAAADDTVGLYLELSLTKTVTPVAGAPSTTAVTESGVLLEIVVQIPGGLQGKGNYVVYRRHNGAVQTLTTTLNSSGEYITVNAGRTAVTIHARLFSIYAIGVAAPASPESGGNGSTTTYYSITATAGDGGSISPCGIVSTTQGGSKTFTVVPDKGYAISNVLVDNVSVGAVSSYTFSNITASHTITAVFTKADGLPYYLDAGGYKVFIGFSSDAGGTMKYIAPKGKTVLFVQNPKSFTDVADHWAAFSIAFVTQREVFQGTGSEMFSPDSGMTRGMLAVVIGRLYERSYGMLNLSGPAEFTDVAAGAYYATYVSWAEENGIIEGDGGGEFDPDRLITREEMALILYRFAKFLEVSDTEVSEIMLSYSDITEISSWAIDAVKYCQVTNLITGRGKGNFAPKETATRAEVATILQRFITAMV